jgi:hypothetical protein
MGLEGVVHAEDLMKPAVRTMKGTDSSRSASRKEAPSALEAAGAVRIDSCGLEYKSPFSGDLFF